MALKWNLKGSVGWKWLVFQVAKRYDCVSYRLWFFLPWPNRGSYKHSMQTSWGLKERRRLCNKSCSIQGSGRWMGWSKSLIGDLSTHQNWILRFLERAILMECVAVMWKLKCPIKSRIFMFLLLKDKVPMWIFFHRNLASRVLGIVRYERNVMRQQHMCLFILLWMWKEVTMVIDQRFLWGGW